jgi:benzodiazapine receptor
MGIASYLVYISHAENEKTSLTLYGVQLAVNFFKPLIFFEQHAYFAALLWILLLWLLILATLLLFYKISKPAAWMLLPYLLGVTFSAYLNGGIWILNR